MWRKFVEWHRKLEEQQLAWLEQPALADQQPPGLRRLMARQLATLSPIERQQLRDFSLAYRGRRIYFAIAKLALLFTLCGILLHLLFLRGSWVHPVFMVNLVGFGMAMAILGVWFNYRRTVQRKWAVLFKTMLGVVLGAGFASLGSWWFSGEPVALTTERAPGLLAVLLGASLLVSVPAIAVGILRNRQHEALTAQLQRDAERERLARELSESQLRVLRAQIEPHFLFNTLGAVQQLAQHGAPRAAELTANLIAFLRASLGDMRSDQVSLSAEFGLVESYLKVMQVRLGERLRFSLALPPALEQVPVPSMILLTLAENAVKHGIEPALRGGGIAVSAELEGAVLRLSVRDSGVGMSLAAGNGAGSGMGLQNVRDRLRLAYGEAAALALEDLDPGLLAAVTIPHPAAQEARA
jgi:signal transduction histidine kinase